jgi:hypothetical protein
LRPNGLPLSRRPGAPKPHKIARIPTPEAVGSNGLFGGSRRVMLEQIVAFGTLAQVEPPMLHKRDRAMNATLFIVTGAPGSGKTTTLQALLHSGSPYLAFDIDWLTIPASQLARSDIIFDRTTWPAYNALWFEILHSIHQNRKTAIFFAPLDAHDVTRYGQVAWCERIEWLLLDCDDATRQIRLNRRSEWTAAMIGEALTDAQALREQVAHRIDTGTHTPDEVATAILSWVERTR